MTIKQAVLTMILSGSAILSAAPVSFAIPVQFIDCVDSTNGTTGGVQAVANPATCSAAPSANDLLLSEGATTTLTFSHNINDNGFLPTDLITSVSLVVDFRDDGGAMDGNEPVTISIDFNGNGLFTDVGEQITSTHQANNDFTCTDACNTALIAALVDGLAAVSIAVNTGGTGIEDTFFVDSLLTVNGERNVVPTPGNVVPVPGTLLLVGAGLAGLTAARAWRRR